MKAILITIAIALSISFTDHTHPIIRTNNGCFVHCSGAVITLDCKGIGVDASTWKH